MKKVEFLRKKYPKFVYQKYNYKIFKNDLKIFFDFEILPDIKFCPEIIIKNVDKKRLNQIGDKVLNNFIFHLGLMEIPSYWKATCSPIIEIKAGYLGKNQIKWWKDFILNGMGQFFYKNQINFTKSEFVKIYCQNKNNSKVTIVSLLDNFKEDKILVPMGEGKDSIVTLELLKKKYKNINCFIVNRQKNHFKILKIASIKNPIIVQRRIDSLLLDLNRKGFLNGHTPITALISNLAVFCAFLFGYNKVVMSCEKSADEGNLKYLGREINHQWSKSFEFEKKFKDYLKKYLFKKINYFSLLRPLYEIQIAKIFSQFPQYFPVFLSCNEARKTASGTKKPIGKRCGKCLKCLFVWTILYPFIKEKKLVKIFKKNLFEDKKLIPVMEELIGVGSPSKCKPFECVGTQKESLVALYLSYKKYLLNNLAIAKKFKLPAVLDYFEEKISPKYPNIEQDSKKILNSWNNQYFLPEKFDKSLLKIYSKNSGIY